MNNFKRIIAGILTFATISSIGVYAYVPSVDDVPYKSDFFGEEDNRETLESSGLEAAYSMLLYTGIAEVPAEDVDVSLSASKALAARYFAGIKGSMVGAENLPYKDVSEITENYAGICSAYSYGIIDGAEKFNPTTQVKPEDVAKMSMKAVGYDKLYQDAMSYASEFDIFEGVDISKGYLTVGELIRTVENSLAVPYVDYSIVSSGDYTISEGDISYLEKNKNIVVQSGVVTGVKYSSIYGDSDIDEDKIEINRGLFEYFEKADKALVGKSVRAYVDTTDDERKIVSLWEYRNNYSDFEFSEIDKVEYNMLYTLENKKYKLSADAKVLYNDVYFGTNQKAVNEGKYDKFTRISVIDNDNDGIYDVIKVYKHDTFVVKSVSTYSERIDLKYGYESINLGEEADAYIERNGEEIPYNGILPQDVISVYGARKADGTPVYTIYASSETVAEVLKGKDKEDDKEYYVFDKAKYPLSDNFIYFLENDTTETKPSIGGAFTFLLSHEGEIAGLATQKSGFSFGWLMRAFKDDSEDELCCVQVYTLDASVEKYYFKEKVKFYDEQNQDGKKIKASEAYTGLYKNDELVYSLVAYKLNADNEIVELALPLDCTAKVHGETDYPLTKDYTNAKYDTQGNPILDSKGNPTYNSIRNYMGILDARYYVSGIMPLVYPVNKANRTDEKQYAKKSLGGTDKYFSSEEITLYNVNKFYKPSIITLGANVLKSVDQESTSYIITRVKDSINADDMPVKLITYSNGTTDATKTLAEECIISEDAYEWQGEPESVAELRKGDIIQLNTNTAGEIDCIRVIYKADKPSDFGFQDPRSASSSGITMASVSGIKVIHGIVKDYDDKTMLVDIADKNAARRDVWPVASGFATYGKVTYNLFETKTGKVSIISRNEIESGDEIVIRKRYNYGVNFYVIR